MSRACRPLLVAGVACVGGLLTLGSAVGVAAAQPTTPALSRPAVVVIGAPDLQWRDVTASGTPQLWNLLPGSATGALSIKAVDPVSCTDDGWLTLGAGNRVTAQDRHGGRCPATTLAVARNGSGADVPAVIALARHNAKLDDGSKVGAMATAANAAGACVSAAGAAAALGAADSTGHVDQYLPDPQVATSDLSFLQACPITLITATAADAGVLAANVRTALPAADVIVVGLAESGTEAAHLHVAIGTGPGFADGRLVSASTRRAPFVQLVDVAPTVLSIRGVAVPSSMIGEPWRVVGGSAATTPRRVSVLADLDLAAQRQTSAIVPFFVVLVGFMLAASGFGWLIARRSTRGHDAPVPAVAVALCVASALVPAASFTANVVPWWRAGHPLAVLAGLTLAGVVVGTAAVYLLDRVVWRRTALGPIGAVGVVTAAVIGVDLLTGAHLQIFSMAGYSPLVAGRFAGIGNVAFGVFAAGALLAIAALAASMPTPRGVLGAVTVLGLVVVAVDGGPSWGSDVGGVLALVPTLVLLAGWLSGASVS